MNRHPSFPLILRPSGQFGLAYPHIVTNDKPKEKQTTWWLTKDSSCYSKGILKKEKEKENLKKNVLYLIIFPLILKHKLKHSSQLPLICSVTMGNQFLGTGSYSNETENAG